MTNKGISKIAFNTLDGLTDVFPTTVPKLFQALFFLFMGNRAIHSLYQFLYRRQWNSVKEFGKILIVSDVNLGDAVMLQQVVQVMRSHLPVARLDYVCNRAAVDILPPMIGADHVFGIFNGSGVPASTALEALRETVDSVDYSVVLNFCPFLKVRPRSSRTTVIDLYIPLASYLIRRWKLGKMKRHMSLLAYEFMREYVGLKGPEHCRQDERTPSSPLPRFEGNSVLLSESAMRKANEFLLRNGIVEPRGMVFFNPDAPSRYTQMPFRFQADLLAGLLALGEVAHVLLAQGRSNRGIEVALLNTVPAALRKKITIVPEVDAGVYASLADACEVFISSDTGPVHIAASRKLLHDGTGARNRLAVVTVIGSTDPGTYAYDSGRTDLLAANQEAPSHVFVAEAPCRNITCLNKYGKSCAVVRCFTNLGTAPVIAFVGGYLRSLVGRRFMADAKSA